jgi:hypothetical protein
MTIPATPLEFETELKLRNHLPVTVTCEITGEFKQGECVHGWDWDFEEIDDLKVCHNGFELDLEQAEELEIEGKIWDEYERTKNPCR